MIENLKITNYQGHKHSEFEFADGINVIIGQTDSGKSAVMRALLWPIENRPLGDSYRSSWGGDTEVEMKTESAIIKRHRDDNENYYSINEDMKLTALGTGIPSEITSILKFSDVNIQRQMDSPFLISETSGEVAKYLNRIVNIEKIDSSLTKAEGQKRECKRNIERTESELEELNLKLLEFNFIEEFESDIESAEAIEKMIEKLDKDSGAILQITEEIEEIENTIHKFDAILKIENDLIWVEEIKENIDQLQLNKEKISDAIEEIRELNEIICEFDLIISIEDDIVEAEKIYIELIVITTSKKTLEEFCDVINTKENELGAISKFISSTEKEIKSIPNICPTCGQVIQ